jgi:hypothetical protein
MNKSAVVCSAAASERPRRAQPTPQILPIRKEARLAGRWAARLPSQAGSLTALRLNGPTGASYGNIAQVAVATKQTQPKS